MSMTFEPIGDMVSVRILDDVLSTTWANKLNHAAVRKGPLKKNIVDAHSARRGLCYRQHLNPDYRQRTPQVVPHCALESSLLIIVDSADTREDPARTA